MPIQRAVSTKDQNDVRTGGFECLLELFWFWGIECNELSPGILEFMEVPLQTAGAKQGKGAHWLFVDQHSL
jgi:hypothetical protein